MFDETAKNIFELPVDALAHGCNIKGIMNGGIARELKARYPAMFKEYASYCKSGSFSPGDVHFYRAEKAPHVINMAIQIDLKKGARLDYIEQGLLNIEQHYAEWGIERVAMPRIGCGLGGLEWKDVRRVVERIFGTSHLEVLVAHTPMQERR